MSDNQKPPEKWYFKTSALIGAFLALGPLALPLLWLNPRLSKTVKVIVTIIVSIATYYLTVALSNSLNTITKYYQQIYQLGL